eukprot:2856056-Pleurochrysis_carterae.AAC.1
MCGSLHNLTQAYAESMLAHDRGGKVSPQNKQIRVTSVYVARAVSLFRKELIVLVMKDFDKTTASRALESD